MLTTGVAYSTLKTTRSTRGLPAGSAVADAALASASATEASSPGGINPRAKKLTMASRSCHSSRHDRLAQRYDDHEAVALGEVARVDSEARHAPNERHAVAGRERYSPERALSVAVQEAGHDEQRRSTHKARREPENGLALLRLAGGGKRIRMSEILEQARMAHGLERMDQIKYAVLERTGGISIVPRSTG